MIKLCASFKDEQWAFWYNKSFIIPIFLLVLNLSTHLIEEEDFYDDDPLDEDEMEKSDDEDEDENENEN